MKPGVAGLGWLHLHGLLYTVQHHHPHPPTRFLLSSHHLARPPWRHHHHHHHHHYHHHGPLWAADVDEQQQEDDPHSVEVVSQHVLEVIHKERVTNSRLQAFLGAHDPSALRLDWIPGGATNFCFRLSGGEEAGRSLFVKYAKDFVRGFEETASLPRDRVDYEYEGFLHMSQYMPEAVPQVILCQRDEGLLVSEYLEGYNSLANYLAKGDIGSSKIPQVVATLMGKLHAGSLGETSFLERFPNSGHIAFWNRCFFPPLYDALKTPYESCTKPGLAKLVDSLSRAAAGGGGEMSPLSQAVKAVHDLYAFKKQALVHADLHCNNILLRDSGEEIKVIDAEKFYYGPCGIDVGQFLSNYVWYMAVAIATGDESRVQLLEGCVRKAVKAYTHSFLTARQGHSDGHTALAEILHDALGFIGLWILFLTIACPVTIMEVNLPTTELVQTAQENLVRVSSAALLEYSRRAELRATTQMQEEGVESEFVGSLMQLVRSNCQCAASR